MKKITIFLITVLAIATSCKKEEVQSFEGDYTFKIGGHVEIAGKLRSQNGKASVDTVFVRYLPNEIGQMHIVQTNHNCYKVTVDAIGGAPLLFDATVSDGTLNLVPIERNMFVYHDISTILPETQTKLTVGGEGHLYNNLLIINLAVTGKYEYLLLQGDVIRSNVNCIAKKR